MNYANMNNVSWDGFRYFMAAAEGGSLTVAAKLLGSNQPTVGRKIDALEAALGVKLFQRSVNGLLLTEEGANVFAHVQTMRLAADSIQRSLHGDEQDIGGTVRVALPEGLCIEVLAPSLPLFYAQHPNIHLILNVSANAANLTRGEADIAVRLIRPKESNLIAKRLGKMTLGLFASSAYIEAHGRPLSLQDLPQHRIITYGDQLAGLAENRWLINHAAPAHSILSSDNTLTRLKATLAGVGVSIQPKLFCRGNPDLLPVIDNAELPGHEIWIVYHNDLRHLARIRAVIDFLAAIFAATL